MEYFSSFWNCYHLKYAIDSQRLFQRLNRIQINVICYKVWHLNFLREVSYLLLYGFSKCSSEYVYFPRDAKTLTSHCFSWDIWWDCGITLFFFLNWEYCFHKRSFSFPSGSSPQGVPFVCTDLICEWIACKLDWLNSLKEVRRHI